MLKEDGKGGFELANYYEIDEDALLVFAVREAKKTGRDYVEFEDRLDFGDGKEKSTGKDGTVFPVSFDDGDIEKWYENFGEDNRKDVIVRKENKVDIGKWDEIFGEKIVMKAGREGKEEKSLGGKVRERAGRGM